MKLAFATLATVTIVLTVVAQDSIGDRTIDGSNNNLDSPLMGAAHTPFSRFAPHDYQDDISAPGGAFRPNVRHISNMVFAQMMSVLSKTELSDMVWQWGQFLDHDITLAPPNHDDPSAVLSIHIPTGDPVFDPLGLGNMTFTFTRSLHDPSTGDSVDNPREQINEITHWIDASVVYGSDDDRAASLRTFEDGLLRTSNSTDVPGEYLPLNTDMIANENPDEEQVPNEILFLAGDTRVNEQIGLIAIHTLFIREHNRVARQLQEANSSMSDEELYQGARKIVGAYIQTITYNEWLPALMGVGALEPYTGYNSSIDATIRNEFATAIFRVGHTMLSSNLAIFTCTDGQPTSVPLREVFFDPETILEVGIGPVLKGLAMQVMQEVDRFVVDDVRNFLFEVLNGAMADTGLDLVAFNIERGHDHGIADFNSLRHGLGLPRLANFSQMTSDDDLADALEVIYDTIDDVDPWVGCLCEDHINDVASLGETLFTAFKLQFELLRDGDRFFYLNDPELLDLLTLLGLTIEEFEDIKLSDIILLNTNVEEIQEDVFTVNTTMANNICESDGDVSAARGSSASGMLTTLFLSGAAMYTWSAIL